jgi:DNA-binding MarR family transcriptional regulator
MTDADLVASWGLVADTVTRSQIRVLGRVEESGLHPQWFWVLHLLLQADDHRLPMSRIAADMAMTSGGFTKLADRMARDGLIDRRNSVGDRRVIFAALTDEGLRTARRTEKLYLDGLREHVLDVLGSDRLAELAELMRRLDQPGPVEGASLDPVASERDPALPERRQRAR